MGDWPAGAEEAVRKVISAGAVTPWFQPVVCLRTGEILGYEALARGPAGCPTQEPRTLFSAAGRAGCAPDLERLCRVKALEAKRSLAPGRLIFINVDPRVAHRCKGAGCVDCDQIDALAVDHGEVVFEVTERVQGNNPRVEREINHYRARGFKFALNDVGMGHSGLTAIVNLKPDYLKIKMFLVQGADRDPHRSALIRMLVLYCRENGTKLIAEGIDTSERLAHLCRLGVDYGQGFHLARPASTPSAVSAQVLDVIRTAAHPPRLTGSG